MTKFIELTLGNAEPITINSDHVVSVTCDSGGFTVVSTVLCDRYCVRESVYTVTRLLQESEDNGNT